MERIFFWQLCFPCFNVAYPKIIGQYANVGQRHVLNFREDEHTMSLYQSSWSDTRLIVFFLLEQNEAYCFTCSVYEKYCIHIEHCEIRY